jgi:hypothetical protein
LSVIRPHAPKKLSLTAALNTSILQNKHLDAMSVFTYAKS